jgi:CubicO group peptidase (beta-lactamase class C family)
MNKLLTVALLLGALFAAAGPAGAQSPDRPSGEELARFFDEAVPALMEEHHVVGAVVGVTDPSRDLFLRGYGSADLETGTPVEEESTLFRAGSITKLLTWTAVMQLWEQGKLRLDDPVEKYLDFELPHNYPEPIRIIDLMNHTPGFEDRLIGLMVQDRRYLVGLREAVSRDIPRRVRPPGRESSYSNYGTMLAGYVVQRLSGMPYERYVEANILQPLGMRHSSLEQPLQPELAARLSTAYAYRDETYVAQEQELINGAPAGALSTTAPDMLRFYRAFLNGGKLDGRRILQERTVREMQKTSFRHDPRAAGFAHGFFEIWHGDLLGYGHGGDTIYFHSESGYLPDQGLGYFVSTNSAAGMQLNFELQRRFLDRFYPAPTGGELAAQAGLKPDLGEYTGLYSMDRRSESDPTQIMGAFTLISPKVSDDGEGLRIASILDPEGSVYVPVARDIFQQREGSMRIVFLRGADGRVRSLYSHDFPAFLFSRVPWIEHPAVSLAVLGLGVLFLLTGLIAPPTGLLTLIPRLRPGRGAAGAAKAGRNAELRTPAAFEAPRGAAAARPLALWSARGYLVLVLLQVAVVASLGNFIFVPIGPANAIPLYLAAAAAVVMLVSLVPTWRRKLFRPLGRLHVTALALSQALLVAWLGYWGFFFL